jgi:hypothetical protein
MVLLKLEEEGATARAAHHIVICFVPGLAHHNLVMCLYT